MSQISDPKIAFAYLRPPCVLLTKKPSAANVETLSAQLKEVNDAALQQLQDYVLFPLRFVLKVPGPKKDKVVQAVADAMCYVLENTCVQSWDTLHDLFSELCLCLCCPTDPGKPADTSEELKSSVLKCLDALLHSAYGDIFFKLYEPVMLPGLGATVSLLLALAEKEKSRDVQAAALKCLLVLTQECDCSQEHICFTTERRAIGRTVTSFLPGITTAVAKIITGDLRQGHAVTVRAMKVPDLLFLMIFPEFSRFNYVKISPFSCLLCKNCSLTLHRTQWKYHYFMFHREQTEPYWRRSTRFFLCTHSCMKIQGIFQT